MRDTATMGVEVTSTAHRLMPRLWLLVWLGLAALTLGLLLPHRNLGIMLELAAGALFALAFLTAALNARHLASKRYFRERLTQFVQNDTAPTLCADAAGIVKSANRAAEQRFGEVAEKSLVLLLGDHAKNPVNLIFRLQRKAGITGSAREDILTIYGLLRVSVQSVSDDTFIWRMERLADRDAEGPALIPQGFPMLLADAEGRIHFANKALTALAGRDHRTLETLLCDVPRQPDGLQQINGANGPVPIRLLESIRDTGLREILLCPAGTEMAGEGRADRLYEDLPIAMLKLDASGAILQSNRLARSLLGHSMNANIGLSDLIKGLGRSVSDWLADAAAGRGLGKAEVVQASRPESEVFLQVTLGRVSENGTTYLIAVLHDATELKTLEAQFVQSQKMQAIGQLAGGVAHDFNNLLTAISGYCDLLLLRHDEGDPNYGDLVQIHQNANRAASLVGQLLAFSRKQNLQPEILDLREALSDLTNLLNRLLGETVRLRVRNAADLATVRVDKRQLEQVLINLVVNARDAMPGGGEVTVACTNERIAQETKRDRAVVPAGDYVSITVTDTGSGIAPDRLRKIFEPFFTTKGPGEGTGLGLSTAYGIIKQTGGFIFVESDLGSGTVFTILLPAMADTAPKHIESLPMPRTGPAPHKEEGVVLLVEDEAPVRAFAARALRMRGYQVLEAGDAAEALKLLSDKDLQIDIFVTDVIMPGMNGPTWVSEARKTRPDVGVVFVSGYAEESFSEQQAKIPNSVFLPKPFSLGDLTATVQAQLH